MYEVAIILKRKWKQKFYAVLFLTLCLQTVTIIKCFSLYSPHVYYFKHCEEGTKVIAAVDNLMIF